MASTVRYYSSDALATTLASALGTTGNPSVVSIGGLPTSYPFTMLIDWGSPAQEAISVTSAPTGTGPYTLPCTRGIDGSTAGLGGIAHNAGAVIVHGVTAQDFDGPNKLAAGAGGFPWQFNPLSYGAAGDGQVVNDGVMSSTSSTTTLTCATSTPFKSSDVGKAVMVKGAVTTATGTTGVGTITGFTSSSVVTVSFTCTASITGAMVLWATDDTSAFQQAVNAAVTWAQAQTGFQSGPGYAEVFVAPPAGAFYGIAGPLVQGGSTLGNAQITLPVIASGGAPSGTPVGNKVSLVIRGAENGASVRHWNQTVPATNISLVSFGVFASAAAQTASASANGNPAVIGGPTGANGYGTSALNFSNMQVTVKGLSVYTTHSLNGLGYGAFWFHGLACASLFDVAYGTVGTYYAGDFSSGNVTSFGNGASIGLGLPAAGNNDSNQLRNVYCMGGYKYGLFATEHTDISGAAILYCYAGLCPVGSYGDGGTAIGSLHAVKVSQLSIETCTNHLYVIGTGQSAVSPVVHGVIDSEATPRFSDNSSGNGLAALRGEVQLCGASGTITVTNGTALRLINVNQGPGPVTQIGLSAGVPAQNTYWRPATVILQGGSGITTVQVSNLMGGASFQPLTTVFSQSAGALPLLTVRVGPGAWIQVNGGSPATNNWILD